MIQTGEAVSSLEIRLFGPFDVLIGGRLPQRPLSRKARYLLALLALRHNRGVERAWLAGTLWPESEERQALWNLRQCLFHLRRSLGPEAHRLLSTTPRTLRLDLAGGWMDAAEFDRAIAQGDESALERAAMLYRGPLLEDCLEEWAIGEREAREQAYLVALERLARQKGERGENAEAATLLRLVVRVDPLRESAQRSLMCALAADGNYAAAVQVYRDLRLLVHRELNTEPNPETAALFQQIRDEACRKVKDEGGRMKDEFACLHPSSFITHPFSRLPHPLTELIGREEEVSEIKGRLAGARLVTLTGTGGVGKSRLAMAVAEEVAEEYADGVWFVELATLTNPALVPQTVASTLGVRETEGRPMSETVSDFLRGRQALLVLDNCEHLRPECARLTAAWLCDCPRLRALATSRQPLGLTGEVTWPVPSLSLPDSRELLLNEKDRVSHLMGYAAIRLFVERATGAWPAFKVDARNIETISRICQRLDGIPLAIELAAARVRAMPVEEVAARLGDSFRLLTGGTASLPRHQTLQATMDWSYDLLTEQERLLLARLSVFAGGWTLEAAEAVAGSNGVVECGTDGKHQYSTTPLLHYTDVLDLLTSLIDKSLVVYGEASQGGRYHLLQTVRQYASGRLLENREEETVRSRHRDLFLALAERAYPEISGPQQKEWLDRLEREHDNMRAALDWCQTTDDGAESGLRLGAANGPFWSERGHLSEGRECLAAALSHPKSSGTQARGRALFEAGWLAWFQGDFAAARLLHEEGLAIAQEVGDTFGVALLLLSIGAVEGSCGDYSAARFHLKQSLARFQELGERAPSASCFSWLGLIAQIQGDYTAARALLEAACEIDLECARYAGHAPNALGNLLRVQGDYVRARLLLSERLATARESGNRRLAQHAFECLACLAHAQGQSDRAARLWGAAEALREATGVPMCFVLRLCDFDRDVAGIRAALGEEAYKTAWEDGRAMTPEHAIAYALDEVGANPV